MADLANLAARHQVALKSTFPLAMHAHQDPQDPPERQDPLEETDRLELLDVPATLVVMVHLDRLATRDLPDPLAPLDPLEIAVQMLAARLEPQDRQELPVTLDQLVVLVNQVPLARVAKDPLEPPDQLEAQDPMDKPVNLDHPDLLEALETLARRVFAPSIALLMVVFSSPKVENWFNGSKGKRSSVEFEKK